MSWRNLNRRWNLLRTLLACLLGNCAHVCMYVYVYVCVCTLVGLPLIRIVMVIAKYWRKMDRQWCLVVESVQVRLGNPCSPHRSHRDLPRGKAT